MSDALLITVAGVGAEVMRTQQPHLPLLPDEVVLIAGGARVDHALAKELGYDAGFGPGTTASRVAAFLLEEISRRKGLSGSER